MIDTTTESTMQKNIFKTKRVGLVGSNPVGKDYMAQIKKRAKFLSDQEKRVVSDAERRQLRLPNI